ncbi:ABC transporter permease subunit [Rhodobacterales bacterium HKCCE2091]|nr:ABC transporter permease subunit [Rhodobacterales bacterium HKCCE2091]
MLRRRKWMFAVLAVLPTLAIFAWVRLYPIAEMFNLSLRDWDLLSPRRPFIGLENFIDLFDDRLFIAALINTTIIALGVAIITIPSAIVIAALIHSRAGSKLAPFYETAIFVPHVVSLVPAALAWKWIFDSELGPLNAFLGVFGIDPVAWLHNPTLAVLCVIVLCSWQALGYAVIIYLVGFKNLPVSLYEAARLDGASARQSFWFITVPLLKPITLYVSVVILISGFNVYAQPFVLASDTQGSPSHLVRVLVYDMIENSFSNFRIGYASAEAVILLSIVMIITVIQFSILRDRSGR